MDTAFKMKKQAKKKKTRSGSTRKKIQKIVEGETEEKPFHYGGLPERNLKKNLGC
jgi:hypothetical protein